MEDFNMVIMLSAGEIPEFTHLLPPLVGVAEWQTRSIFYT